MNKSIIVLVEDTELIGIALKDIKNQLGPDLEEALIPAAYIESHQTAVMRAQNQLVERSAFQHVVLRREESKQEVKALKANLVNFDASMISITAKISDLEAEEARLLGRLETVRGQLKDAKEDLAKVPDQISATKASI